MSIARKLLTAGSALCLAAITANAAVISKTNSITGIFDASSGVRAFNFSLAEAVGTITDVNISIQFAKHDGETFGVNAGGTPFYNEIVFQLTSSGGGPTAHLIDGGSWSSGSGGFLGTINFDDQAATVVNAFSAPTAGTFRTTGSNSSLGLNQFNGLALAPGNWNLFIQDTVGADSLDFYTATLTVTTNHNSVPDSGAGMFLMTNLSLAGLVAFRSLRRRNS